MSPALAASFFAAREDASLVVLEGFHALKHALRFGAVVEAAVTSDPDGLAELSAALAPDVAAALEALVQPIEPAALRALGFPRPPHTGVAAIARRPQFDLAALLAGDLARPVVLLEDPRHLGNVGAVVRVAAAADAAGVVTTGTRDPWDAAALRGAAGLHYALPVGRADDGFDPAPRVLVALDPDGDPLPSVEIPPGAVLAFGTERHGLSDALLARADARLRIPMRDGVSSLNLATAVSAVLFSR
ncbi:MAG TPA: TrmH family RNA methyltransferase [Conexibacter sp.]|nr:TrmH family RNA methyltransferase [Conexibacter sp.]